MTSFDWHDAFARAEARGLLRDASGPAGADDIAGIVSTTGLEVPEALRVLLEMHDGQTAPSLFGGSFDFLSSFEIAAHWEMHVAVLAQLPAEALTGVFDPLTMVRCDTGVRPLIANRKWLPFADSNGNTTRYIDFDPAAGGRPGQVIEVDPEATEWRVLAPSFDAFLIGCLVAGGKG